MITLNRKKKEKVIQTIHFEDNGQDFLSFKVEFYADFKYGTVLEVQPTFQSHIWQEMVVLSGKPTIGGRIAVSKAPEQQVINIKHKIINIS